MTQSVGDIEYVIKANTAELLRADKQVRDTTNGMESGFNRADKAADKLQTSLNKIAGAIAASFVADWGKAFLVAADNMSQINARIKRLTGSAESAAQTMQSLMQISSTTGGSLQDTAKLWETLGTALRDTGATNGQIIQLTETLQKIGRIGGSSSEEMANALRQFGQSISSGVVRAEEFNSILEQMPELARQIAAGMGVSIGQLRQLMLDGKLTAEDALNAIQKQTSSVNAEFDKLPRTLSQANTAFTNSVLSMVDSINQATGASSALVAVIDSVTATLDRLIGKSASAAVQISDLTSTAEMFERRARTWGWLGLDGWEAQSKALAGLSNRAAMLVGDLDAVTKASALAANTKPIEIKATAIANKPKAGKSSTKREADAAAESLARQQAALDRLNTGYAEGSLELAKYDAVMALGNKAATEQITKAEQQAESIWKIQQATKAAAEEERKRTQAGQNFTGLQGQVSPVAAVDNSYAQQMAQLDEYVQLYPQKIAEAEAVRSGIEDQYHQKRMAAMWEEWQQQSEINNMLGAAIDSLQGGATSAITGLINGTQSLQESFANIGTTILNSVVGSLVQMGIEWVKSQIMGQAAAAASLTSTMAQATAAASAWAPAAMSASIATYGSAAAVGQAAYAGSLLAAKGMAVAGARYNGGPVDAGSMYRVGEKGKPEIFQASNGSQYMIPGDNGRVISNRDMQGAGNAGTAIQQEVHFHIQTTGGIDDATMAKMSQMMKRVALFQINDQANRPNGLIQPRTKR